MSEKQTTGWTKWTETKTIPADKELIPQVIRLLELAIEAKRADQPDVSEIAAHAARMIVFPAFIKSGEN